MTKTPILELDPTLIAPRVMVVGDPNRAKRAAEMLEDVTVVSTPREYFTYTGTWRGMRVTVSSHGIGAGGASICFEELIQAGAQVMIRAGTCGSFRPDLKEASLVIATGAVRNDGTSDRLIPMAYPAVADFSVTQALINAMPADIHYGIGLCLSDAHFYPAFVDSQHHMWSEANILAVEMEVAPLFVIASLRGIRAGAILNVDNYVFERQIYAPNREIVHAGTRRMLAVTFDALVNCEVGN